MTQPGRFQHAEIVEHDGEYILRFMLDDGAACEILASFDQLDELAEKIDRQLDADEE